MSGEAWHWLTITTPSDSGFLKAFASEIADSWPDVCSNASPRKQTDDCAAYDGDVDFVPGSPSDYFDLLLTKRIYRSISKKHPVGVTVTRYRFDGSKYVPAK